MKILAIETSTEFASIALAWGSEVVSSSFASPPAHSAKLLPTIAQLLTQCGATMQSLDAIAFGAGPGSFTGVRLACSVAQGLALGVDIPLVPICSLLALAEGSGFDRAYCALDARMNEVYVAAYERSGEGWAELLAPICAPPGEVPVPSSVNWFGIGTAFGVHGPLLAERLGSAVAVADGMAVPRADALARLALSAPRVDPALATPLYVRDKVAQTVAERIAQGGRA